MDTIRSDLTVSVTELKRNPTKVSRLAGEEPVVVLNHNQKLFYLVHPTTYENLVDENEDLRLSLIALSRMINNDDVVMVDIETV